MIFNIIKRLTLHNKETPENWHEDFIVSLASVMKPKVYIELGVYECALFNKIIPYASNLIGVDTSAEAKKFMKSGEKTKFICSTTDEFAKVLKESPIKIDMLFIDANHSKESVLQDFHSFFPFIVSNGLILFHDSYPKNEEYAQSGYCGNAYEAIEELAKTTDEYELMTVPQHPGLTMCRKRNNQISWRK